MDLSKASYLILLLVPGFLAVKLYSWTARPRRFSDAELALWSVSCSMPLLIVSRWLLSFQGDVPSFDAMLKDPVAAPNNVRWLSVMLAVTLGWAFGKLDKSQLLNSITKHIGLDLRRSIDLWQLELSKRRYVEVWLKDGTLLYGWPIAASTNRKEVSELALQNVRVFDSDKGQFTPYESDRLVLVDMNSISYLVFCDNDTADSDEYATATNRHPD